MKHISLFVFILVTITGCNLNQFDDNQIEKNNNYNGDQSGMIPLDVWMERAIFDRQNEKYFTIGYYSPYSAKSIRIEFVKISGGQSSVYHYDFAANERYACGYFKWNGKDKLRADVPEGYYRAYLIYTPLRSPMPSFEHIVTNTVTFYLKNRADPNVSLYAEFSLGQEIKYDADITVEPNLGQNNTFDVGIYGDGITIVSTSANVQGVMFSGGHQHNWRNSGSISKENNNLFHYSPSDMGGRETIFFEVSYTRPNEGQRLKVLGLRVNNRFNGLIRLMAQGYFGLTGGTLDHYGPNSDISLDSWPIDMVHWSVVGFNSILAGMALDFYLNHDQRIIYYNDMSLPFGGYFHKEIDNDPNHTEGHGIGAGCDLPIFTPVVLSVQDIADLQTYWYFYNQQTTLNAHPTFWNEDSYHYHLFYRPIE